MSDSDELGGVPLIENISSTTPKRSPAKRKREEDGIEIKKTTKRSKSRFAIGDVDLDLDAGINKAVGKMDGRLISDFLLQQSKRFQPDMSVVELEDTHIPERSIADTTWFKPLRTTDKLPEFLELAVSKRPTAMKLASSAKTKGSPHTLVVTAAGLRAADLTRVLRKYKTKDAPIAKLFAKHIKMEESVKFLKSTRVGIGVGTPQRLMDLMQDGALSIERLERIAVDSSHIDQKKRGILDMKDTQVQLVKFLNFPALKTRYSATSNLVELLFY